MLKVLEQSSDPVLARKLLDRVKELAARYKERTGNEPSFMEVCGSHTMALARTGIKALLQGHVNLISGPGCPVCVTDQKDIDAMIELADGPDRILCTFGDMMRVPGSKWSLMEAAGRSTKNRFPSAFPVCLPTQRRRCRLSCLFSRISRNRSGSVTGSRQA